LSEVTQLTRANKGVNAQTSSPSEKLRDGARLALTEAGKSGQLRWLLNGGVNLEKLRDQACQDLMQLGLDGTLKAKLQATVPVPEKLKADARSALTGCEKTGQLRWILNGGVNVESLRAQAFQALTQLGRDGTLEAKLQATTPEVQALREKARDVFVSANAAGTLEPAVQSLASAADSKLADMLKEAQNALTSAVNNGRLLQALDSNSPRTFSADALKLKAYDSLMSASQSGTLEASLEQTEQAKLDTMRREALLKLSWASGNGTLAKALEGAKQ